MSPVVYAAIAVCIGTAAGFGRPAVAVPSAALATVGLVVAIALGDRRRVAAMVVALVGLGAAASASASWRSAALEDALLPRLTDEGSVRACGVVRSLRPRSVEVRADEVEHRAELWKTNEAIRVSGDDVRRLRPGERVCASGEVHPARPGRDEAPLLAASSITKRGTASVVRSAAAAVRARFSEVAHRVLPKTHAGLLLGMTDGDVASLDDSTIEAFRTTGLAHLVAVSGSNVAVVLIVVMLAARALVRRSRWLRVAMCAPALIFFAFLTGLEPSVLRATATAAVALVITAEGRVTDGVRIASLAFVLLVLASPELMFHPGFQLSFAATLGLIAWGRPLTDRICARIPQGAAWTAVAACVATTLAAQAAAAPLLAWHFDRIPAVGGLANVAVAPLAPVVMIGGVITLGLASVLPFADQAPVLMRLPLDVILWSGRTFAELPGASVDASVVGGVALAAALAVVVSGSLTARRAAVAVAVVACGFSVGGAATGTAVCAGPSVVALDVGQGTAVLLRAEGHAVLVDGGPDDGGLVRDLREERISRLDAVFVSHPHADHTQGVVDALEKLDVGSVIGPVTLGWGTGGEVVAAAKKAGVGVTHAAAGDTFTFGADISIEAVFPEPGPEPLRTEEAVHGWGLVLRAEIGGTDVLLPGDIGADEERTLLDADVDADLFVAPHHGSKDLDPRFVDSVSPHVTLVTVGADNTYGHPAPEALAAYARHGRMWRTDKDGTVTVCLNEHAVEVSTQR